MQGQIVSQHHDHVLVVSHGYGGGKKPEDYLESFRELVRSRLNEVPALLVVTQRPRDLKREDLRALKLTLDGAGFKELDVQTAWRDARNEEVAATIIGYIRQLALGSPLVPYATRVDRAHQRLLKAHTFTEPQRKWLDRIAAQVKVETVVDKDSLDKGEFRQKGGFAYINKAFDGKLEAVLGELAAGVWEDTG
jgi:type I restriction enzyme R subunit